MLGSIFLVFLQRDIANWTFYSTLSYSSRLLYLSIALCAIMLFAFFSGILTSLVTARSNPTPITSFADLEGLGLHVLVMKSAIDEMLMKESKPGSALHNLYYGEMIGNPDHLYPSHEAIVDKLRTDPTTAEFGSDLGTYKTEDIIHLILDESFTLPVAFGYPKHSEFVEMFNHLLLDFGETGTLDRILRQGLFVRKYMDGNHKSPSQAVEMDFKALTFPYLILLFGIMLGTLISFCEVTVKWRLYSCF